MKRSLKRNLGCLRGNKMVSYPNEKPKVSAQKAGGRGHSGALVDSGLEGRALESMPIRKNSRAQGKKSAGDVGGTNMNAA